MSTQSTSPANISENRQTPPVSEIPEPAGRNENIVKEDEPSGKPLFAISEPLREDQVQNAVKFLSHPRVRGSPVIHRRSFLEKKGLTKEEIDEAFRRVPDPPSDTANIEASVTKPAAAQANSITATLQPQAPAQAPQIVVPPANGVTTVTSLQKYRFQWSHALFAIGVLAASGAGTAILFKNMVVPRLKGWIRKVVSEENESLAENKPTSKMVEEAVEVAKAAASAATVVAEASKELLNAKTEERKYFEAFMGALDVQVKEMKSMSDVIQRLERREDRFYKEKPTGEYIQPTSGNGPTNPSWRTSQHVQVNGTPYTDFGEARPSSAPAYMNPTSAPAYMNPTSGPYSNSYMPGMNTTVAQRGEKPTPFKPWEVNQQTQERRSYNFQSQSTDEEFSSELQGTFQPSQFNSRVQDNSDPKKKNVRITEVDSELSETTRQFPYGTDSAPKPKPRAWVPPQPPSVVMPEAAAAIRQPKSSQKQSSGDDRSAANSVDGENGVPTGETSSVAQMENLDSDVPVEYGRDGIQEERVNGIEAN